MGVTVWRPDSSPGAAWAAVVLLLLAGCASEVEPTEGTTAVWGEVYDGADPTVPFLPDQNARYWRYAFERPATGTTLRFHGTQQGARYQAFDAYDDESRTSVGALRDTDLDDTFVIHFTERGDIEEPRLPVPDGQAAVFLRLYDPEGLVRDPELPLVDLLDPDEGVSQPPPGRIEPQDIPQTLVDLLLQQMEIPQREDRVDFYRLDAAGLYAAADNQYLVAQIVREPGEVVVIRFRQPTWSASGEAQVRYWSLTQCDRHSYCHHTLADHQVSVDSEMVEVVIGDDDPALRAAAAGTRSFVPWSTPDDELLLIYRNLATADNFGPSIQTVPIFDFDQPAAGQEAPLTLGEYGPAGRRCGRDAFLAGNCDI